MNAGREIEIKLPVPDIAGIAKLLDEAGFRVIRPRAFESNVVYDTPAHMLREGGRLLRVRRSAGLAILTYKGPSEPGKHKSREELETKLEDAACCEAILTRLGYEPIFRYEKYRTEYEQEGSPGIVTLDETPIGTFLEIEGEPEWIDRIAQRLGFREDQYILASYGGLYLQHRTQHPEAPFDMTFPSPVPAAN